MPELDRDTALDTYRYLRGGIPVVSVDRAASYSSGSGTSTLTFTYVVAAGQNSPDLDYASTGGPGATPTRSPGMSASIGTRSARCTASTPLASSPAANINTVDQMDR